MLLGQLGVVCGQGKLMAATLTTVSELRLRLDQAPAGTEVDAQLQAFLDSAEATVLRQLPGLTITPPAPDDLTEIIYQLASSLYLTRGTAARLETVGADGQGGYQ